MRIKCPNCGSTAQITLMYSDINGYKDTKTDEYKCGCGCCFAAIFKLVNYEIEK